MSNDMIWIRNIAWFLLFYFNLKWLINDNDDDDLPCR